jgi:hypothetical protein
MSVTDYKHFAFPGVDALYQTRALSFRVRRLHALHIETSQQDIRCCTQFHYADIKTLRVGRELDRQSPKQEA